MGSGQKLNLAVLGGGQFVRQATQAGVSFSKPMLDSLVARIGLLRDEFCAVHVLNSGSGCLVEQRTDLL